MTEPEIIELTEAELAEAAGGMGDGGAGCGVVFA